MANRFNPIKNSFVAGRLSPNLEGRDDLDQYFQGLRQALNGIVLPYGGFMRRSGLRFVSEVQFSAQKTRLLRFQVSTDQAYVIEAGALYFYFYANEGRLESGGLPVSVVTPYTAAELDDLQFAQEADVMYVVHPNHPVYKLARTSATSFTFTEVDYTDGHAPLRPDNLTAVTMTYTNPGTPTLTSSSINIFDASTDIGRYVRATDGANEVWLKITGVSASNIATGTLEGSTGTPTSVTATTDWALGATSDTEGFYAVTFHQGRIAYGGTPTNVDNFWLSKSDDYDNFELSDASATDAENADKAIAKRINSGEVNAISWMVPADESLIVGTAAAEYRVEGDSDGILTPTASTPFPSTSRGSKRMRPAVVDAVVLFIQRNGRKLREYTFDLERDGRIARDISILAAGILRYGANELSYQQDPNSVIWVTRGDGALVGFTYEREQRVIGAHLHAMGGSFEGMRAKVESSVVIPNPLETADQLWMIVKRTVNGTTKQYIEFMEDDFDPDIEEEFLTEAELKAAQIAALDTAFFVDSGLSLDTPITITGITQANPGVVTAAAHGLSNGNTVRIRDVVGMTTVNNRSYKVANVTTNTFELTDTSDDSNVDTSAFSAYASGGTVRLEVTTLSGLSHLEGETVQVLADGGEHPDRVVSSGAITLDRPASIVHVGLGYETILETQRFVGGGRIGTDQGQLGRIQRAVIRLLNTMGVAIGVGAKPANLERPEFRGGNDVMDNAPPLFSGDKEAAVAQGWVRNRTIFAKQDKPLPMTVLAVMPKTEVGER